MIKIIDTFKDYKEVFEHNLDISTQEKIRLWEELYSSKYPEVINKLKDDIKSDGYNWVDIARENSFNKTKEDFSKMVEAYENIKNVMEDVNNNVKEAFNLDLDINIVLYAGLCHSAGWVDEYEGKRAILYGIDQIANLNWQDRNKLKNLIAHELCHIIHFEIRDRYNLIDDYKTNYEYGIWRLYIEGFAQFYRNKLTPLFEERGESWVKACDEQKEELKKLYIEALNDNDKGTNDFFGDWWQVMGISDVGYYLGQEFVKELSEKLSLKEVITIRFEGLEKEVLDFLER
ncbi:MAG: DUF5700 domain-containing putative Zn-dependent protease [Paraclostridium sp.]